MTGHESTWVGHNEIESFVDVLGALQKFGNVALPFFMVNYCHLHNWTFLRHTHGM